MAYRDMSLILTLGFYISFASKQIKGTNQNHDAADSGSGFISYRDDVDLLGFSGDFAPTSLCRRQEIEASARRQPDAFVSKCNEAGEFELRQCHHEQCWCVNIYGHEVAGTRHNASVSVDCLNLEKSSTKTTNLAGTKRISKEYSLVRTTVAILKADDVIIDETKDSVQHKNKIDQMTFESSVDIGLVNHDMNEIEASMLERRDTSSPSRTLIHIQPGLLAGIIGGTTLGLLCIVLFVMFLVYRMRKKDEGSYALDEPKSSPPSGFKKPHDQEFFA